MIRTGHLLDTEEYNKRTGAYLVREKRKGRDGRMGSDAYKPGKHTGEALAFMKERVGKERFDRIMESADSRRHPYVAARLFLSAEDWRKYVWIEQNGSLDGFS